MGITQRDAGGNYQVPVPLVHKTIVAVVAAVLAVGGYMIVWAINDADKSARLEARIETISIDVRDVKKVIGEAVLPVLKRDLTQLEKRVERLEKERQSQ
jgi:Tfp pilus assembly protein PilO